jgi:ankyrin repeat protein
VTRDWEAAARSGDLAAFEQLWADRPDINGRDRHGQIALMITAQEGHEPALVWLVVHGAGLDHTPSSV